MPFYPKLKSEILSEDSGYKNKQEKLEKVVDKLVKLKEKLSELPSKSRTDKLLLATFNIREFDSNRMKQGPRTSESMFYLAEIISSFDLVAVQEVNKNLTGLKRLMSILGSDYSYICTDVTEGSGGNAERMCFIYDCKKIKFRNIAGEIVLPPNTRTEVLQFARTPYLVSFQAGWFKFNLCTVHIFFGADTGEKMKKRVEEIGKLSKFFEARQKREKENFILLGDFNIIDRDHETMDALKSGKFHVPDAINKLDKGSNVEQDKYYDQIVYSEAKDDIAFNSIKFTGKAGVFDYYETVFSEEDIEDYYEDYQICMEDNDKKATKETFHKNFRAWRTFQMSDHLPLWVEFDINYSKEYLASLKNVE